jgi:hypothetical protein
MKGIEDINILQREHTDLQNLASLYTNYEFRNVKNEFLMTT